jgi:transposase-like protein
MTRKGRHPLAFRRMAVERMKGCENITALSEELGVARRQLYLWRQQFDPVEGGQGPAPESPRESTLRKENHQLKRVLAEKTLEVDFFKGVSDGPFGPPIGMKMRMTRHVV